MSDWNAKWDWGSPGMLNSNTIEIPKGGESRWGEAEMGSFYPFGGGVNNGSCSDLGSGLFIMSSSSAFLDSSMKGNNTKTLHFDGNSDCFGKKQEENPKLDVCATSPSVCASIVSGETMLGLKLGKRTYFEDVCAGNNVRTSPFSVISDGSDRPGKKKISSSNAPELPRCQVQGCSVDLSSAKEYHRKHRVCETHTKCPKVVVGGQERRFCQQCSRFHSLFEFDEKKRSCRKRLSDHNARRRKPQSETMQFDTTRLVPSLYERRQHNDLIWNGFSRPSIRAAANNITWENSLGNELIQTKELLNPLDDQQQHIDISQHPSSILSENDTNKFFSSSKGAALLAFSQGFGEYTSSPGLVVAQDRALSLLSPNMWGPSCEPSHTASLERPPVQGGTQLPWAATMLHGVSQNLGTQLKQHYHHHHHYHDQGMMDSDNGGNDGHLPFHLFRCRPQPGIVSSRRHSAHDD